MSKTANLTVRIDPTVKQRAEDVLEVLGISASNAINMFYKQIILQHGIPFDVKVPQGVVNLEVASDDEIDSALAAGYRSLLNGDVRPVDEVFSALRKDNV
jgi:addiction module RelB/DinJ family antitoxin